MTDGNPTISVVMYDGGYRERFHLIDCLNQQTLNSDIYEMIWVDYYDEVVDGVQEKEDQIENLTTYTLNRDDLFFIAKCWNKGIKESQGEIVVLIDADLYVEDDFLQSILDEHDRNSRLALYFNRLDEPEPEDHKMKPVELSRLRKICKVSPNCYGACLSVRKRWLEKVNGYEEHPVMAGRLYAGAMELNTRLKNLGLDIKWYPDKYVYHPWHPTGGYEERVKHTYPKEFRRQARFELIERREKTLEYLPYKGLSSKEHKNPDWINDYFEKWENNRLKRRIKNGLMNVLTKTGLIG